jgi:hypothetical protein
VTAPSDSTNEGSRERNRQSAWREIGLSPPAFLDDRLAPAVDKSFLRRLVRDELPEAAAAIACRLILLFPSWSQAHQEVVDEIFKKPGA